MAQSFNEIVLIGRLTRDPEVKFATTGTQIATFTVAVNRDGKTDSTDFIPVVAFAKRAEFVGNYLTKGMLVLVSGALNIDKYKARDETMRTSAKVVARDIRFMEAKNKTLESSPEGEQGYSQRETPEDIMFFGSDNSSDEIPF